MAFDTFGSGATWAVNRASLNTNFSTIQPYVDQSYNPNARKLKKARAAFGKVRNGTSNARVLLVGDSTVTGSGANGPGYVAGGRAKNLPVRLAQLMNSYMIPTRADAIIGSGGTSSYTTFDPRITKASWAENAGLNSALGNAFSSSTNGAVLTFTPTNSFDSVQVWYPRAASQGTFTVDIGGASSTAVNASGANALLSTTVTATLGTATVNITKTNTSANYVLGIRTWNSAAKEVEIFQAGWSGAVASQFVVTTNAWDSKNQITDLAPDLTIIDITINDAIAATSIATYKANLQSLVTACLLSGDVIMSTGIPSIISSQSLATQQTFIDAAAEVAATNNIMFVDIWRRFESYEISQPVGFYADTLHPSGTGYADWASALFNVIRNI